MTDPLVEQIGQRLEAVRGRIEKAAVAGGRDPASVRIVAVTKEFGIDVVSAGRRAGLDRFGESRVQEAEPKIAALPAAEWHLVGHLQSNKARRAVRVFGWIESIDSAALLERVERLAAEEGRALRVLVQVRLVDAPAQHGLAPEQVPVVGGELPGLHHVDVVGLMGIGPQTTDPAASRAAFARLSRLRDELEEATGRRLPELSMGMSDDFEAAIAEGATLVRLGTALFGPRPA